MDIFDERIRRSCDDDTAFNLAAIGRVPFIPQPRKRERLLVFQADVMWNFDLRAGLFLPFIKSIGGIRQRL